MKTLHDEFYELRDRIWCEFEKLVREGCDHYGEIPIIVGEYSLPANGLRTISHIVSDTCDIVINGILPNEDYYIFPPKESEKDINVITNKIKVLIKKWSVVDKKHIDLVIEVEPNILDLQILSTYISGGFDYYNN